MNSSFGQATLSASVAETVQHHRVLFLVEGIALVVLGILALLAPMLATVAATLFFGWILLLSGLIGLVTTIRARRAPGLAWSLLSAVIGLAAGVYLLVLPVPGAVSLTLVLTAFLLLEGVASILFALEHRRGLSGRWGWVLASGILYIALGAIILSGFPGSALWVLGLLVGINLLFGGWALIAMALHAGRTA